MTKRKEENKEKIIIDYAKSILEQSEHWRDIKLNGCNDPSWSDGCCMNLVRDHILYYKKRIEILCEELKVKFPEEYYIPTPPKVPDNFMAHLREEKRVANLKHWYSKFTTRCPEYNSHQLSIF